MNSKSAARVSEILLRLTGRSRDSASRPAPAWKIDQLARARVSRHLAEAAFDPGTPGTEIARCIQAHQLYCEALIAAAKGLAPDEHTTIDRALSSDWLTGESHEHIGSEDLATIRTALERDANASPPSALLDRELRALTSVAALLTARLASECEFDREIMHGRAIRIAALGAIVALAWLGQGAVFRHMHPDLAAHGHWTASSGHEEWLASGVGIPRREAAYNLFFHTADEERPWIRFDLGHVTPVSYVTVNNRGDCCLDRAVPLAVQVSDNDRDWVEVARRNETFLHWSTSFRAVPTRFVRFQLLAKNSLHFTSVEIR